MTKAKAIEWYADEVERLQIAPELNGCPMTQEWAEQIEIHAMAIAALKEQGVTDTNVGCKWFSVEDALPADNEKVLCFTRNKKFSVARWSERQRKFVSSGNVNVTHWMPLPQPPKEEV